jgi:hypothetical protein
MLAMLSYTPMQVGYTIFIHKSTGFPDVISTYVDNMGLIFKSLEQIDQDKEALWQHYEMTDLGKMGWILSICMTHNHKKCMISLSQQKFIKDTLECYGMQNTHPISFPALANEHLLKLPFPAINAKAYQWLSVLSCTHAGDPAGPSLHCCSA